MNDEVNPVYVTPGTEIGFYKVETLVGKGGFGALYRVVRNGQVFALKLSTSKFADLSDDDREHYMARSKREAGALMQLRHSNVVQVHGFEQWPDIKTGFFYLVMDFIDGWQLNEWRREQTPTLRQIALAFQKIARALNEIHRCEIFHRDLKSENVLIRKADGEPILVDFGLARPRSAYTVTHVDDIVGSYSSFTPEYCKHAFTPGNDDKKPFVYRPTTDLHAVGYMLYEALAGRPPFDAGTENQIELLIQIEQRIPIRPGLINCHVPGSLDEIAMKLLEKQPENRFQTGLELAVALAHALERADDSWDVPLQVPPRPKPNGSTQDLRHRELEGNAVEGKEPEPVVSDTHVKPVEPPATAVQAAAKPEQPPVPEQALQNETRSASISGPAFAPPSVVQRAFVPPEGASAKQQSARSPSALSSAIRNLRIADRASAPSRKAAPFVAALGLLLVVAMGTALVLANRAKAGRRPENLLAKFSAQTSTPSIDVPQLNSPANLPAIALNPESSNVGAGESHAAKQKGARRPGVRKSASKGTDEANIDSMLASTYGRPNIPEKPDEHRVSVADPPWLQRAHRIDRAAGKQSASAQKKLGVPFGTHLRAKLATNLDSRTIGDGLVEAVLSRPFVKEGEAVLPTRTMLYGQAHTSGGGRFTVQFFRLRLPDNTEVPFTGLAVDIEDNKPGLAASGRIAGPPAAQESLAGRVLKNTAGTMLGKLTGDDATDVARGAGQTALSYSNGTSNFSSGDALLLDAGRDFEVIVKETF